MTQWRVSELRFSGACKLTNPHLDADIWAVFTGPNGETIRRPAFWDGGMDYAVRFAPISIGKWSYVLSAAPASLELDGLSGEFDAVAYSGELPMYQHGFLKLGPRGRYLCHADNTPFFWLGDTHWSFVTQERWNESNCERYASQFKGMVDKRAEQGFTVYQCNMHCGMDGNSVGGHFDYFKDNGHGWEPVLAAFRDNMDLKMDYLADHGFLIALGFAWYSNILEDGAVDFYKMAARYVIARYGAHPVVWTLAGEVAGYTSDTRSLCIDRWREVALEIERLESDGYQTLQTCHYTNERPLAHYYQDETWHDFTLNQCGHADLVINQKVYREHLEKYPVKPFIEGEALYDGLITIEDLERREVNTRMVRLAAYTAIQNGACGYTYGAQGCWNAEWDWPSSGGFTHWGTLPWYVGIEREGANSLKQMRKFYESVEWWKLQPMYNCCQIHNRETTEQFLLRATPEITADPETRTVVAYYKGIADYALCLKGLAFASYKMQWWNPSNGEYTLVHENARTITGRLEIPAKPDREDWVLLLTANI